MSNRSEREGARQTVEAYHEGQLATLLQRAGDGVEGFRNGEIDAFEADRLMFQYSRSAKELWKFCNGPDVEFIAELIRDRDSVDWWERGAPRRR